MPAIPAADTLTDDELIRAVSGVLAVDRTVDNSFVLHAPLELLARADLLAEVSPGAHDAARARLVSLAEGHASSGDPIPPPDPTAGADVDALVRAIEQGDVDTADAAVLGLATTMAPGDVCRALAAPTLRSAAAAAHAPILLANWGRTAARRPLDHGFVRGIVRRLSADGSLRFEVPAPAATRDPGTVADLEAALRRVPLLGSSGWGIYALVHQAESSGLVATMPAVAPADVDEAFRVLFRVAATSMVLGSPEAAPYEWTHCLSLPIGLWLSARIDADPADALDIAITHVVGFRAAHGDGGLPVYDPTPTGLDLAVALGGDPPVAAATAFHAPGHGPAMQTIVDAAAVEHDAHLVKYVHALLDAIAADPDGAALYRAAGASLVAWWRRHPPADDPLA